MARKKRNDLAAGIFILAALAGLILMLVLIHDWQNYGAPQPAVYHVEFPQTGGVKVNSPVLLGGWTVGRVAAVGPRWSKDAKSGAERFLYDLALEIPPDVPLRQDAQVRIESKLIGEGAAVNIFNVGSGPKAVDTEKRPIVGQSGDVMADAATAVADMKAVMAEFRQETAPKIGQIVDDVAVLTADLRRQLPGILKSADTAVAEIQSAVEQIDAMMTENRDKVKVSLSNIQAVTQTAKDNAGQLLGNLTATSNDIRALVAANRMNLSDTMVNLRQTSEQLKAASEEIRRAPWRLLYKPDQREADTLNVYDASRAYADAAASLQSTALTLESLVTLRQQGVPIDEQVLRDTLDRVQAGLKRYNEAEEALWKQWGAAAGKP